jgi:hypothetical protein
MGPGNGAYGDRVYDDWAAERFRLVVEHLRWHWGDAYEIGVTAGLWTADRRDGRGKLEEDSPEALRKAILADYQADPVPRELPPGEPSS